MFGYYSDSAFAEAGENGIAMRYNDGVVRFSHFRNPKAGDEDFECDVYDRESWRIASRVARCLDRYGACSIVNTSSAEEILISPRKGAMIILDMNFLPMFEHEVV